MPEHGGNARIHTPVLMVVVVLRTGEIVLVDTGMADGHVEDPSMTWRGSSNEVQLVPVMARNETVASQLKGLGMEPAAVTHIVNTHLHFDHAGNNKLFPRAKYIVQRDHLDWAKGNPECPERYWEENDVRFEAIRGEVELWDGVSVVPTPGHVPGHQSVVIRGQGRPLVICGDAIFSREALELDSWGAHRDPRTAKVSGEMLVSLARRIDGRILYGHDPIQASRIPLAPAPVSADAEWWC